MTDEELIAKYEKDLLIESYCQDINLPPFTETWIRVTHIPTGKVYKCNIFDKDYLIKFLKEIENKLL